VNAICLVIDRLRAGCLGAYGNSWIETPATDRLAAESFVFDQALVDTPRLDLLYRSYWQGWPALTARQPQGRPTLPALLAEAGVATAMSAPMMPKTNSTEAMSANRFQPSACLQAILLEPIATHFRQSRTTPTLGSSAGQLLA